MTDRRTLGPILAAQSRLKIVFLVSVIIDFYQSVKFTVNVNQCASFPSHLTKYLPQLSHSLILSREGRVIFCRVGMVPPSVMQTSQRRGRPGEEVDGHWAAARGPSSSPQGWTRAEKQRARPNTWVRVNCRNKGSHCKNFLKKHTFTQSKTLFYKFC